MSQRIKSAGIRESSAFELGGLQQLLFFSLLCWLGEWSRHPHNLKVDCSLSLRKWVKQRGEKLSFRAALGMRGFLGIRIYDKIRIVASGSGLGFGARFCEGRGGG